MIRVPHPWETDQTPRRVEPSADVPRPPAEETAAALPGASLAQVASGRPGRDRNSAAATAAHLHRWHRAHGDPLSLDAVRDRVTQTLTRTDRNQETS